jgi:predicted metal-dependent enzyme (double-stranded beta helix superfamily)
MVPSIVVLPRTGELIDALAHAVNAGPLDDPQLRTAERVATVLRRFLHHPDLLTPDQQEPDPAHYRQHVLYVEPAARFSLMALVWLPGQQTPIHDHTCWCVAGTYRGCEQETAYRAVNGALVPASTSVNPVGAVTALAPPGDIHRVRNGGAELAISLHVYGADVLDSGGSIRRSYTL